MIETIWIEGVPRRPWFKKLNPLWWFGNDEEPQPPTWYEPDSRWRVWLWYLRNPLHNFLRYVIGVCDRGHWVTGPAPADKNFWSDIDPKLDGWKPAITWIAGLPLLPYISRSGHRLEFNIGWQPTGRFALRITIHW